MARILSPVWSIIRGSIGGTTYTANQYHQIIARAKTAPVNPRTTFQTMIRSAFSGSVALWNLLSDTAQDLWNDYADTLVFSGPVGTYTVPGREVFIGNISTALYLQARVGTPVTVDTTPPSEAGFLNISNVQVVTPILPGIVIAFTAENQTGAEALIFSQRSFKFGSARNRFKGQHLSSTLQVKSVIDTGVIFTTFEGLVENGIYFTNPRAISALAPFRMSAPFSLRHVAEIIA